MYIVFFWWGRRTRRLLDMQSVRMNLIAAVVFSFLVKSVHDVVITCHACTCVRRMWQHRSVLQRQLATWMGFSGINNLNLQTSFLCRGFV